MPLKILVIARRRVSAGAARRSLAREPRGYQPVMDPVARTPTEPVDYAALSAGYGTLLGALLVAMRDRGEEPIRTGELPALGLATFALSKMVAKEKVDSWVREPFVEERATGERRPKGRRLRYAVGELLTCTRCTGAWASLALTGLRVLRPREGRVVTALLTASAVNDITHTAFAWLCAETGRAQADAGATEAHAGRAQADAGATEAHAGRAQADAGREARRSPAGPAPADGRR
jgi:hypothetical protein